MKKFYITTSIAYTNAFPHIGFALESLQADVLARYHRLLNEDVFFLTGTDEHGLKIKKTAREKGRDVKEFVDEIAQKFKELKKVLNLSNDGFIRTSDRKVHWPVVQKVWLKLKKKGDIYKKKYQGLYCIGCESFITKKDLINGKCPIHKTKPEMIKEENYFFRLSKYSEKLFKIIDSEKIKIIPKKRKNEVLSFIKKGLEDISFSRPKSHLDWGIPVPDDESQTIYVWFDALSNYISALGYPKSKDFKKYWPADVHCIGKDILKFHALYWPAILLSLELKLPKRIFVHGFITVGSQKMSKSLGNIINPFELVEKYGTDAVRYYLLREIPSAEDGDFTYQKFEERYNSDLASGIGNLAARIRTMADKKIKERKLKDKISSQDLIAEIRKTEKRYKEAIKEFKFNEALKAVWELIAFSNKYIDQERPWEDGDEKLKVKNHKVISDLVLTLGKISRLLNPFLPETSEKIKSQIERDKKTGEFRYPKIASLFPRL